MSFRIKPSHKFLVENPQEKPEEKTVFLYNTSSGGKTSIVDSTKVSSVKKPSEKPAKSGKKGLTISTDETSQADYM